MAFTSMTEKVYNIKVVPNSKTTKIVEETEFFLKIKLTAPPEKGKANKQLINFLSKYFKTSKNNIQILAGELARVKIVKINY